MTQYVLITNKVDAAKVRAAAAYRQVEKPPIMPACENCAHLRYDSEDREGAKGVYFTKSHIRCVALLVQVNLNCVCFRHEFKYPDCREV